MVTSKLPETGKFVTKSRRRFHLIFDLRKDLQHHRLLEPAFVGQADKQRDSKTFVVRFLTSEFHLRPVFARTLRSEYGETHLRPHRIGGNTAERLVRRQIGVYLNNLLLRNFVSQAWNLLPSTQDPALHPCQRP